MFRQECQACVCSDPSWRFKTTLTIGKHGKWTTPACYLIMKDNAISWKCREATRCLCRRSNMRKCRMLSCPSCILVFFKKRPLYKPANHAPHHARVCALSPPRDRLERHGLFERCARAAAAAYDDGRCVSGPCRSPCFPADVAGVSAVRRAGGSVDDLVAAHDRRLARVFRCAIVQQCT